jgi:hypothetical protein
MAEKPGEQGLNIEMCISLACIKLALGLMGSNR